MEVMALRKQLVITPQNQVPAVEDKYAPRQRRVINRGIAQSEKEYQQGLSFGPFETHETFIASLETQAAKLRGKRIRPAAK